jgi:prophage regulatory protein
MIFPPPPPPPVTSKAQPAYYRLRDVVRITALSRSTIYRRIAEGRFPAPVHLGGKASGWAREALQCWIKDPAGYAAPRPPQAAEGRGLPMAGAQL